MLRVLVGVLLVLMFFSATTWFYLRGPDIPFADLEATYSTRDSAFIDLSNGVRLHYQVMGPVEASPIVLLHGYGDSFTSWASWLPMLSGRYRVYTLDLPGHGLTRSPANYVISSEGYTSVIQEFSERLMLGKFAIVGNSMGGGVAWQFASRFPDKIQALVLVASAGWPLPPAKDLPIAFRLLQFRLGRWFLTHIDNKPLIRQGLRNEVFDPAVIPEDFIARWAAFQRAPGHRQILMSAELASFATATPEALQQIHAPTLILHGDSDPLIPLDSGRKFVASILNSKIVVYPRVGHLPQIEIPERSARDVLEFLNSLSP